MQLAYAGYKANIVFLRNFLAPIYEIHDIKQNPENEYEILTRWTFSMQFWWLRYLPFIKASPMRSCLLPDSHALTTQLPFVAGLLIDTMLDVHMKSFVEN